MKPLNLLLLLFADLLSNEHNIYQSARWPLPCGTSWTLFLVAGAFAVLWEPSHCIMLKSTHQRRRSGGKRKVYFMLSPTFFFPF